MFVFTVHYTFYATGSWMYQTNLEWLGELVNLNMTKWNQG